MSKAVRNKEPASPFQTRMAESLQYRITLLHSALFKGAARDYARLADVGLPEARVLSIILLDMPLSASDVAQRSAMDKGQVSRAIASLIKRGYVTRASKPGGGRRVMLSLTRSGKAKARKTFEVGMKRNIKINSHLTAKERTQLFKLLDRLIADIRDMNVQELETPEPKRRVA